MVDIYTLDLSQTLSEGHIPTWEQRRQDHLAGMSRRIEIRYEKLITAAADKIIKQEIVIIRRIVHKYAPVFKLADTDQDAWITGMAMLADELIEEYFKFFPAVFKAYFGPCNALMGEADKLAKLYLTEEPLTKAELKDNEKFHVQYVGVLCVRHITSSIRQILAICRGDHWVAPVKWPKWTKVVKKETG